MPLARRQTLVVGNAVAEHKLGKWTRLAIVIAGVAVCSGLIPGQAQFVPLIAEAGVFSSSCSEEAGGTGDATVDDRASSSQARDSSSTVAGSPKKAYCEKQFIQVSEVFNGAMSVTLLGLLPNGLLFDRYGGHCAGCLGAVLVVAGMLLMQISLVGAKYGYDSSTSQMLAPAMVITDVGSMLASYAPISFVWHFPSLQTFIIAIMTASYQVSCLAPYCIMGCMHFTNSSFSSAMLGYTGLMVIGGVGCYFFVPHMNEYRAEAKKVLGIPLPKPNRDSLWKKVKLGNDVLRVDWVDHTMFITSFTFCFVFASLYGGLVADYGEKLLHSNAAKNELPQAFNICQAVLGITFGPASSIIADKYGNAMAVFIPLLTATIIGGSVCLPIATWNSQMLTCINVALFLGFYQTYASKYIFAYCMPTQFGTLLGLIFLYSMLAAMPILGGMYYWISILPKEGVEHLLIPLETSSILGAAAMIIFGLYVLKVGFPDTPVILPCDELELAQPFGCTNLDEVLYVTHMDDRKSLLKIMSSTKPSDFADLIKRIDVDRVQNLTQEPEEPKKLISPSSVQDLRPELPVLQGSGFSRVAEHKPEKQTTDSTSSAVPDPVYTLVEGMVFDDDERDYGTDDADRSLCAVTCESGNLHRRIAVSRPSLSSWSLSSLFGLRCCQQSTVTGASQPLLDQVERARRAAEEKADRARKEAERKRKVREFNEKLMEAIDAGNKAEVLTMYETEDTDLLWEAYQDLWDWLSKQEMDDFEERWADVIPDDEFQGLMNRRSALKVLIVKMTSFRMKKAVFG